MSKSEREKKQKHKLLMSEKEPKEWSKRKKRQTNEIYSPISMAPTTFFCLRFRVYSVFFSTIHRYHLLFGKQTNGVYAEILYASMRQ